MTSIASIQRAVAEHFQIEPSLMVSPCRCRTVARPRQVAMYLARKLTSKSLPLIGREFGHRDHSTVARSIHQVERLMRESDGFAESVAAVERRL